MILVNGDEVKLNTFPDGTYNLKGDCDFKGKNIIITWKFSDEKELLAIYYLHEYYKRLCNEICLYMPYIPNARMDRIQNGEDVFSLKYFANFINFIGFDNVFVLDPHSNVSCGLINNCYEADLKFWDAAVYKTVTRLNNEEEPIMFYPDEGAMKRYSKIGKPYAFGIKKRDWKTGNIMSYDIVGDNIEGKNVIIRDDICSKGGTFYHAAKKLKELGANNIYLMVTHCENAINIGEFGDKRVSLEQTGLIKHVFTTDSIERNNISDWITAVKTNAIYDAVNNYRLMLTGDGVCEI